MGQSNPARDGVKETAPKAEVVVFDPERKIHLLGKGGEMIKFIQVRVRVRYASIL
jgi:hypothetical protein